MYKRGNELPIYGTILTDVYCNIHSLKERSSYVLCVYVGLREKKWEKFLIIRVWTALHYFTELKYFQGSISAYSGGYSLQNGKHLTRPDGVTNRYTIEVLGCYENLWLEIIGDGGSSVDKGAALQIGMSLVRFQMVSVEFFINIILQIAKWPWGRLSLTEMSVRSISLGVKNARCVRLTTLPPF